MHSMLWLSKRREKILVSCGPEFGSKVTVVVKRVKRKEQRLTEHTERNKSWMVHARLKQAQLSFVSV